MKQDDTIVFLDIETGGLNKYKHPITQLAAIAVRAGSFEELDSIELFVEFNVQDADPKALGINKYNPSDHSRWALAPEVAADKFAAFLRKYGSETRTNKKGAQYTVAPLAGHNAAQFDEPFLRAWYRRTGNRFLPASRRVYDTMHLAMWFYQLNPAINPPADYKLLTLCQYFGLPEPDHSALCDVRSTVALTRAISSALFDSVTAEAA